MDAETIRSVGLGCRDGVESLTPFIENLQSIKAPFVHDPLAIRGTSQIGKSEFTGGVHKTFCYFHSSKVMSLLSACSG
jgi:hypothetical protein